MKEIITKALTDKKTRKKAKLTKFVQASGGDFGPWG